MKIENGMTYDSNYARAAAYFLGSCAPCPAEKDRKQAYAFMTGIYAVIAADPAVIGVKAVPDTAFAPWEQQKGREKDIKAIRNAIRKIEALIAELFALVETAQEVGDAFVLPPAFSIGRALKRVIEMQGATIQAEDTAVTIQLPAACCKGLKELAAISRSNTIPITDGPQEDKAYLYFSRCVFAPAENWIAPAYDAVLKANGELLRLCAALEERGYRRVDCRDGKAVTLDYVKTCGKKQEPLKMAWAERVHAGISVSYEELRLEPCFFWIRMPQFPKVLESVAQLPENVQQFILQHTKTCDGCRYCVQTDKTRTRPLACVKIGGTRKCPRFPGFTMNWRELDATLAAAVLDLLDALEKLPALQ